MQTTRPIQLPERLRVVVTLAQLLEQFDNSGIAPSPDQYRSVVAHLKDELGRLEGDVALDFVLAHFPSTATLYENLHYEHAGLCRSALEASLNTELQAREVMARVAHGTPPPAEPDKGQMPVEPDQGSQPPPTPEPDGGEHGDRPTPV